MTRTLIISQNCFNTPCDELEYYFMLFKRLGNSLLCLVVLDFGCLDLCRLLDFAVHGGSVIFN
jgi:hypothetical protein